MDLHIDILQIALISAGTALAAFLRAFTGFGFALVAVPVFSLILAPSEVVVLTSALALLLGVISTKSWKGHLDGREVVLLLIPAALGTLVGAAILPYLSVQAFQLGAGIAVLISCALLLVNRVLESRTRRSVTGGVGLLSGLMNGSLAIPGPPMIAYALLAKADPNESRALLTAFFSVSALFALIAFAVGGLINQQSLTYVVAALPALVLANMGGNAMFVRYAGRFYRLVASWALVIMGVTIVYRAL